MSSYDRRLRRLGYPDESLSDLSEQEKKEIISNLLFQAGTKNSFRLPRDPNVKIIPGDMMYHRTPEETIVEIDGNKKKIKVLKAFEITRVAFVKHCPGHKNSKGESAEWCIVSHTTGKILSSHPSKDKAKSHLQDMHAHG